MLLYQLPPTHYLTKLPKLGMRKKTLSWSSVKSKRFFLRLLPFLFVARPYYRRHYVIQTNEWRAWVDTDGEACNQSTSSHSIWRGSCLEKKASIFPQTVKPVNHSTRSCMNETQNYSHWNKMCTVTSPVCIPTEMQKYSNGPCHT